MAENGAPSTSEIQLPPPDFTLPTPYTVASDRISIPAQDMARAIGQNGNGHASRADIWQDLFYDGNPILAVIFRPEDFLMARPEVTSLSSKFLGQQPTSIASKRFQGLSPRDLSISFAGSIGLQDNLEGEAYSFPSRAGSVPVYAHFIPADYIDAVSASFR